MFKLFHNEDESVEFSNLEVASTYGALADGPARVEESKGQPAAGGFFSKFQSAFKSTKKPEKPEIFDQSRLTPQQKKSAREAVDLYLKALKSNLKNANESNFQLLLNAIMKGATLCEIGLGTWYAHKERIDQALNHMNVSFLLANEKLLDFELYLDKHAQSQGVEKDIYLRDKNQSLENLTLYLIDCNNHDGNIMQWLQDRSKDPLAPGQSPRINQQGFDEIMENFHTQMAISRAHDKHL
jgi:hypothetical protein